MDDRTARHAPITVNSSVLDECLTEPRLVTVQWTNVDADLPAGDKVFVSTCPASATFLRGHLGDYASTAQRKASLYRCGDSVEVAIDADGLRQQILLANVYFGIPKFGTLVECFDIPTDSCVAFAESLIDQLKPRTVVLMDVTKPGSFSTIVSSGEGLRYLATSVSPPLEWCDWMELPNLLDSCSASLITACEIGQVECYLFASPLESLYGHATASPNTLAQYVPILSNFAPQCQRSPDKVDYPMSRLHVSSSIYV